MLCGFRVSSTVATHPVTQRVALGLTKVITFIIWRRSILQQQNLEKIHLSATKVTMMMMALVIQGGTSLLKDGSTLNFRERKGQKYLFLATQFLPELASAVSCQPKED